VKRITITIEIWQKGPYYLAKAPELDFISQGNTFDEAKRNLLDVIKIQFHEMKEMGTFEEYLAECGFDVKGDQFVPQREIVGFEKSIVEVL
jgi:predicted RNase H-like HicB family nuclease